jgi:ABC-type uncharacterized transport system permease subunit
MDERGWLILATMGYLLSAAWGLYALGARRPQSTRWNDGLLLGSFLAHFLFLTFRGQKLGHCPLSNGFEVAAFLSWSLVLTYLLVGSAYRMSILGFFTAPVVFLVNFAALVLPVDHPGVLQFGGWQIELHASLSVMGYGTLGVAAVAGALYLVQERQLKRRDLSGWFYRLPAMGDLAVVQRRVLLWGFAVLSGGVVTALFIPNAGETGWLKIGWTLLTWVMFAVVVAAPRVLRWSQHRSSMLCVGAYSFLLLTFWGVNTWSQSHRMWP